MKTETRMIQKGDAKEALIHLPASKSQVHRALITAALTEGTTVIRNVTYGNDIRATIRLLRHFGAEILDETDRIIVKGVSRPVFDYQELECGESASTLRFLIPLAALSGDDAVFVCEGRLHERPQTVYEKLFEEKGLRFEQEGNRICVRGPLQGGIYEVRGDVSSQFISGLLFALPLCEEDSEIRILPPFESAPYADMTLRFLQKSGIDAERDGLIIRIKGSQKYHAADFEAEGDESQAAFAAMIPFVSDIPVTISGMPHHDGQADHALTGILRNMGADIQRTEDGYRMEPSSLHGITASLADCPDLGPALFALASLAEGTSVFTDGRRLRIKECDRIAAMEEEMRKLGCVIDSTTDTVTVTGRTEIRGGAVLSSHRDHRVTMALSMLALAGEIPSVIEGSEAVDKSWPDFYHVMTKAKVMKEAAE
ncbi:MAG TPA: 3-phosphoshikimate 1-carboxyvinyltransferase [Erysipelotrichaceae bacterium]|nr:3-phosphoshikimate 1-carboxyvinyltransferase [Erysipelotrichaceae bacterium]